MDRIRRINSFHRTVKRLVDFSHLFDFWVGLAEGLWESKDKLIPSGKTPEETSAYTVALNHTMDSLIVAAIPECCRSGVAYRGLFPPNPAHPELQDLTRTLRLLDLMALVRRTLHSGRLIALVSQPQTNLQEKYQKVITPLVSPLKARYKKYSGPDFPMLDAFLRALVERWLQDLLGSPTKRPDVFLRKLPCGCQDCAGVNEFLVSEAATVTFWAVQKRRTHMEARISSALPDAVTFTTNRTSTPYGLQVTKTPETLATDRWSGRVESARAFLSLVGTQAELARILGDRYRDVEAALAGTKPYKIGSPVHVVAPNDNMPVAGTSRSQVLAGGTRTGPVMAGIKRKAEDDGDVIDLSSD